MDYLKMLNFRHACKIFNNTKKISKDDIEYILEACRLSPSSFGMQPWKIIVVTDEVKKTQIKPLCWNQNQIDSCSHLCIIVGQKEIVVAGSSHVKEMFGSRGLSDQDTKNYLARYAMAIEDIKNSMGIASWVSQQCHILLSNMLNSAAFLGIDSCAIGGFEKSKLEKYLGLDTTKEEISIVATLGYRLNPQPIKQRLDLNKIIVEI